MSAVRVKITKLVSTICRNSPGSPPVTPTGNVAKAERIRRNLSSDYVQTGTRSPVSTPRKNLRHLLLGKIGSPLLITHLVNAVSSPSNGHFPGEHHTPNQHDALLTTDASTNEYEDVLGSLGPSDRIGGQRRFRFNDITDSGTGSMRCFSDSQDEGEFISSPVSRTSSSCSSVSTLDEDSAEKDDCLANDVELDTPTRKLVLDNGIEALPSKPIVVGKGGFGTVIIAQHKGKRVAVKVISKHKRRRLSIEYSLKGERNALALDHCNVVKTFGIFGLNDDHALIIMEYAGQHNLLNILNDSRERIPIARRLGFSIHLANALIFCHRKNIVHLDVKPANVVVGPNDECKLADFGCSQEVNAVLETYKSTAPLDGTVAYKAPELLRGQTPTTKADVYSYGITLWQILLRKQPFSGMDPHVIMYKVVSSNARPVPATAEDGCNFKYVKLFQDCWEGDVHARPTMDDALLYLNAIANIL